MVFSLRNYVQDFYHIPTRECFIARLDRPSNENFPNNTRRVFFSNKFFFFDLTKFIFLVVRCCSRWLLLRCMPKYENTTLYT